MSYLGKMKSDRITQRGDGRHVPRPTGWPLLMKVFFTLPFLLIYGMLLAICLVRTGRVGMASAFLGLMAGGLYLLCTSAMTQGLMYLTGVFPPETSPLTLKTRGAQALVVLGGGLYRHPETGDSTVAGGYTLERLRYTVLLARQSGLPVAVTGAEEESAGMVRTLREDYGIEARWVEGTSHTTAENAALSARLLQPEGITRIVLVTHAWHMGRAAYIFRHHGFVVLPAPTGFPLAALDPAPSLWKPRAELFLTNLFGLSEVFGQVKYRLSYRTPPTPVPAPSAAIAPGNGTRH
ncbi:MAG TPA: YdcF family protein [Fluviicoccus sp.]|nr:YdcF family protein [Fluviicoccus sp.]